MTDLKNRAKELEFELGDIYSLCDEDVCERFNVDSKDEAINLINEELADVYKRLENNQTTTDNEYIGWCDPAFRTMGDFDRMRL